MQNKLNFKADGLLPQKIALGSLPVSKQPESETTMGRNSTKPDS